MTNNMQNRLKQVREQIMTAEYKHGRFPHSVKLLAVSKNQTIASIRQTAKEGQLSFGENYVKEALSKISILKNLNLEWHFIGLIQRNKTKDIAEHFDWVHSLSRFEIAKRLDEQRPSHLAPLNICIEVNIDHEPQKTGVYLEDLPLFAASLSDFSRLNLRGLMAIPKARKTPEEQRETFAKLRFALEDLKKQGFGLDTLSMGMSEDFQSAIAEGATIVRIGSALFGERAPK